MTRPAAAVLVPVVTAAQAAARDAAAIAAGVPSRALMQRAGAAAAAVIAERYARRLARGVVVLAGSGNNGGDAWVVAAALAMAGVPVRVEEVLPARTPDARAEREHALALLEALGTDPARAGGARVVVDGLLGTGASGAPRGVVADAVERIARLRADGAAVVALDVPSGVDASTGAAEGAVVADLTLAFGTMKRGLLVARANAGTIRVLDIGLGAHALPDDDAPALVDARWVRARVPAIAAAAHKGTRGRLAIVGGAAGMAGAVVLAARAALRAGAGLVKCVVAPESVAAVQALVPEALAAAWPADDAAARREVGEWAHGVLVGPGLGRGHRALVERVLAGGDAPAVLDADALNAFAGDAAALAPLLGGRAALLTPHPAEAARLAGGSAESVDRERWDVAPRLAAATRAAVLLKGVPTVVADAGAARFASAAGTPALAAGGSGDLLAGLAATLVMQRREALESGAAAAWLHGRAAEIAGARHGARGVVLADVLDALPLAFRERSRRAPYPVLGALPAVREDA